MASALDKIIVIDLEGTCEEPKTPTFQQEIIEIGLVVVSPRDKKIIQTDKTFVKPRLSVVTPFCTQLTGISAEDLTSKNGARSFPEAINWLKKFGTKNKVWASWGDFDRKLFEKQCQREGVEYPFGPSHLNIKTLFAMFEGLDRGIGVKEATEYLNLPWYGQAHRGLDDAMNISNVLLDLLGRYDTVKNPTNNKETSKNELWKSAV